MKKELKTITLEWDEKNRELLITREGFTFSIPYRNLYSLKVFLNQIYRHYLTAGIKAKSK